MTMHAAADISCIPALHLISSGCDLKAVESCTARTKETMQPCQLCPACHLFGCAGADQERAGLKALWAAGSRVAIVAAFTDCQTSLNGTGCELEERLARMAVGETVILLTPPLNPC